MTLGSVRAGRRYSEEELTILLRQRTRALNWVVEEAVYPLIAERSRGTPRLALVRSAD